MHTVNVAGENSDSVGVIKGKVSVDEDNERFEDSGDRKGVCEMGP